MNTATDTIEIICDVAKPAKVAVIYNEREACSVYNQRFLNYREEQECLTM